MGLLDHFDLVPEPNRMLSFDDGQVDTVGVRNPETGIVEQKPIKITPEQAREVEIRSWREGLASVDHRLAQVDDDDRFPWETEPATAEQVERKRQGLLAEREHVLAQLERLEATTTEPQKRRR